MTREAMTKHRVVPTLLVLLLLGRGAEAQQPDLQRLQGAWVPDGAKCENVFYRQGKSINFVRPGAAVREGILVEGNRIGDGRNGCSITKVKPAGDMWILLVSCFSGLVVSKLSFSIRFADESTLTRTLTDFPEEELRLRRCRI
jgi:hypothetical protein